MTSYLDSHVPAIFTPHGFHVLCNACKDRK